MENIEKADINYNFWPKIYIPKQWKVAFLSALIIGFLTHLYQMTNLLANDDTIMAYYHGVPDGWRALFGGASSGRWLLNIAERLTSWFKTPVASGAVILLFLALTAVVVTDILDIQSIAGALLAGGIIASFPATISFFSLYSVAYPLSIFLAALGVWIANKKSFGWIIAIFLMGISLSIFPVSISFALMLIVLKLIHDILANNVSPKDLFVSLWKYGAVILGGGIFLLVGTTIISNAFSFQATDYQGASSAIGESLFNSIISKIHATIVKTFYLAYDKMYLLPSLKFTLIICYVAEISITIFLFIKNKIYKNFILFGLLAVCGLLIPFALCTMTMISENFAHRMQHRMSWVVLFIGLIMLMELLVRNLSEKNCKISPKIVKGIYRFLCIILGIMLYGFFLFSNICYFNQQYVMEKDKTLAIRILAALEQTKDFTYDDPVCFYTHPTQDNGTMGKSPLMWDVELYRNIFPDTETNLWCYGDDSFKAHMKTLEGIEFAEVPGWAKPQIATNPDFKKICDDLDMGEFVITKYADTGIYVVVVKTLVPLSIQYSA